ncbi:MAG: oligosaccharide flippase family protein [Rhodoferax sp.]|nr:oligosaccharide flippase family protein [Rhodoferax sp.]
MQIYFASQKLRHTWRHGGYDTIIGMNSVRAALRLSFIERYALIALALLSSVLLARLLTPHEIGIYSVTAALVGMLQVIREFGVGNYLIQERELTTAKLETAFGFSLVAGSTMFLGAFLLAPQLANFYADPQVAPMLRVICLNFLILPFCSIGLSMLRRTMRFDRLLTANLAAGVCGFFVTIGLVLLGVGPASLAWGTVACNAVTAVAVWKALTSAERPARPRLAEWRSLVSYGRQSTFASVITSAAIDVNDLVVGKILGFAPVAFLSRAMGLMNLYQRDLMNAARNVAFPAFAQTHREGKQLEPMFVHSSAIVTGVGWPFYGFLCLFPLEMLRLMAGTQWDAAADLVVVFALAGAIISPVTLTQTLVLAVGRVDLASRADVVVSLLRLGLAVGAVVIFRDLMAVAMAFLISFALSVPILLAFKQRCLPTDWSGLLRQSARSLAVTCATLTVPALLSLTAGFQRTEPLPIWGFFLVCLMAVASWVIGLRVFNHPIDSDPFYQLLCRRIGFPPAARKA